jgi:exosome complex RNA-binding protein Csl4
MIPYSWDSMICPLTKKTEKRKVAKPDFESFK